MSQFGFLDFISPGFDIIKGVFIVGRGANHEGVTIYELDFTVDIEVVITGGIMDFNVDLLVLDVLFTPVDIENGWPVFIAEGVVNVVLD